ncbi:MAG: NosD domain-containing protein [Candidatus Kariarchaeaceae archaeon]|jgi:parallel beta-helix repeat protein
MYQTKIMNKIDLKSIKKLSIIFFAFLLLFSLTSYTNIANSVNNNENDQNSELIRQTKDLPSIYDQRFSLNAGPDLVVANISIPTNVIEYGATPWTWVTFTIKNVGDQPISDTTIYVSLVDVTKDGVSYSTGGYIAITSPIDYTVPLAPGENVTKSFAVGHDSVWLPGFYTLKVEVDNQYGKGNVTESDETNNKSPEISFLVGTPGVDLVVSDISIPNTTIPYGANPWTWVSFKIRNNGLSNLNDTFIIGDLVDATRNGVPYSNGGYFNVTTYSWPLFPGDEANHSFAVGHDSVWPVGEYSIRVRVDPWDSVSETDESNNISPELRFTVVDDTTDSPLFIDNDDDFSRLGFPGRGTETDPYVIEGLNIEDNTVHLVYIVNTSVHFILKGSNLNGLNGPYNGIFLENVGNGVISMNSVSNSFVGVKVVNSHHITIEHNTITGNSADGIFVQDSSDFEIVGNNVGNNGYGQALGLASTNELSAFFGSGIFLDPSVGGVVSGNTVFENALDGISLLLTDGIGILDNEIRGNGQNGIGLIDSSFNEIKGNKIFGNGYEAPILASSNGLSAFFGSGIFLDPSEGNLVSDNEVYDNAMSGVHLLLTNDSEVVNNRIFENGQNGIFLEDSVGNLISGNSVKRNGLETGLASTNGLNAFFGSGIFLDPSDNNVVEDNVVEGNVYGIFLEDSSDNVVERNILIENSLYGLYFDGTSNNNTVFQNDFIRNNPDGSSQANDDGSNNDFLNNYWSDHGDLNEPYPIDGKAGNEDPDPANEPNVYVPPVTSDPSSSDPNSTITTTPGLTVISLLGFIGIGLLYIKRRKC